MDVRIARVIGENYAHSLQQTHCVLIFPSDKTGKSERASGSGKEKPAAARQWRRRRRWQRASMCARAHRTDCVCMCVCVDYTRSHWRSRLRVHNLCTTDWLAASCAPHMPPHAPSIDEQGLQYPVRGSAHCFFTDSTLFKSFAHCAILPQNCSLG